MLYSPFIFDSDSGMLGNVLLKANNLSDVSNAATAFGNIKQNATGAATGVIQLAGDLGGTATAPTVTDLTITNEAQGDILYNNGTNWVRLAAGTNGQFLKTQGAGANPLWAAAITTNPPLEVYFDAPRFSEMETNFAPLITLNGTTVDTPVRAFDDTTEEYVNGKFRVPSNINTSGTVTFRAYIMAATAAASKNIALTFGHLAINDSEAFDAAYIDKDSGDKPIDATQGDVTEVTWTETVSNLGWAASDMVIFRLSRDPAATDNLTGDMYLFDLSIEIPRN